MMDDLSTFWAEVYRGIGLTETGVALGTFTADPVGTIAVLASSPSGRHWLASRKVDATSLAGLLNDGMTHVPRNSEAMRNGVREHGAHAALSTRFQRS